MMLQETKRGGAVVRQSGMFKKKTCGPVQRRQNRGQKRINVMRLRDVPKNGNFVTNPSPYRRAARGHWGKGLDSH